MAGLRLGQPTCIRSAFSATRVRARFQKRQAGTPWLPGTLLLAALSLFVGVGGDPVCLRPEGPALVSSLQVFSLFPQTRGIHIPVLWEPYF